MEPVVSRAELKIAETAKAFRCDFRGKVVLDIGSSTGGFTEYALNHGAENVIAIEKGTGQMKAPLRFDARVELHEKTDIFGCIVEDSSATTYPSGTLRAALAESHVPNDTSSTVTLKYYPNIILADVSFVSLKKVLLHAKKYLAGKDTEYLVMLKPQFEARPNQLNKGVVKNERMRREIIRDFEAFLVREGFLILKKRDNELAGKNGNVERFYLLKNALKG